MEFSALKSVIAGMKSPSASAAAPSSSSFKSGDYSPTTTIMNAIKLLGAQAQANALTKANKEHEKTLKEELKDKKKGGKREKDPSAPKKEPSAGQADWKEWVREERIASGQKTDEKGKPLFDEKGDPIYNLTFKEATTLASAKRNAAKAAGTYVPKGTTKTASGISAAKKAGDDIGITTNLKRAAIEEEYVEEEDTLRIWDSPSGKRYWKSDMNECWICNPKDHSRGAWQGIWNPVTRKFIPADEPDI
jgi:hypothetical protein